MRFIGKGIQRFTAVSFALTIVASASVAAAGYPSCPHGATCLQVATGTGNGCTLDNAIVAAEYGETTNGCNPNGATVLLLASTTYYAQNTLYVEGITLLGTGATGSTPTVISFRNVTGGNVAMYFDSLGPQQGGELQDLQVIAGGSTATLTGVQSDVFGSVLDHVVISGFNNSGAINNGGLTIHNSTIERNSADFGGGILDNGGILAIDRSSILNNSALGGAGLDVDRGRKQTWLMSRSPTTRQRSEGASAHREYLRRGMQR
jgi:hypothetical protein